MELKSVVLALAVLTFASIAVSLSATLEAPQASEAPVALVDPPQVCAADGTLSFGLAPMWVTPFCGAPCSIPDEVTACVDNSVSPWVHVLCICSNGYYAC